MSESTCGFINPTDSHILIHTFPHLEQKPGSAPPKDDRSWSTKSVIANMEILNAKTVTVGLYQRALIEKLDLFLLSKSESLSLHVIHLQQSWM